MESPAPEPPGSSSPDASRGSSVLEHLRRLVAIRKWIVACFGKIGLEIELEADLHKSLKNGILLCYLMQNFEPQSIPRIHESTSQSFNYRQNIVFFLAACEMVGVPKNKLFRVGDLWDNVSMVSVVDCLIALAHTCSSKWPARVPDVVMPSHDDDDELLGSVSETERMEIVKQIKMSSVVSLQKRRMTTGYRMSLKDVTNEVSSFLELTVLGDKAKESVMLRGVTRCQAVFRGLRERQSYQHRLRDSAYRERVTYEILSTEQTYVDSLAVSVEVFLRPLEAAAAAGRHIVPEDKIGVIFKGMETILAANRTLLASLSKRLEKWHPNLCVGDVFQLIDGFLIFYTEYIQNYTEAVRVLKREQRKKPFKEFLSKQKVDPRTKGRDLDQFLIMPVQRIPRYNLLLRELVKHTWSTHPDFAALDASVERLANIAMFLNEKKREAEALQRTFHVQEILDKAGVNLQVAGRKYLHEGELYDTQGKAVVVYLFNDLLVVCGDKNDRAHTEADERRANRKKIKFSEFFELDPEMVVLDIVDVDASGKPSFMVSLSGQRRSIQLHAASVHIKKEWVDTLRSVHAKLSSLALLHVSLSSASGGGGGPPGADSPQMLTPSGARTARGSKRGDGIKTPSSATHRRSKSKAEDMSAVLQHLRRSDAVSAPSMTGHSSEAEPPLPEKKRGFFPLASPRMERANNAGTPPPASKEGGSGNNSASGSANNSLSTLPSGAASGGGGSSGFGGGESTPVSKSSLSGANLVGSQNRKTPKLGALLSVESSHTLHHPSSKDSEGSDDTGGPVVPSRTGSSSSVPDEKNGFSVSTPPVEHVSLSRLTSDGSGADKKVGSGTIRGRLGAVMRLTNLGKLWDKEKEEEGSGGDASSSPGDVSPGPLGDGRRPSGDFSSQPALSKRETELAKRTADSDDIVKLGRLMRGRKKDDGTSSNNDSEIEAEKAGGSTPTSTGRSSGHFSPRVINE